MKDSTSFSGKNSIFKNTICYLLILSLISGGMPVRSALAESNHGDFDVDQVLGDATENEDSEEVAEEKLVELSKEKPKLHSLGKYSVGFDDQQGFVPVEGLWGVGLSLVAPKMDQQAAVRSNIGVYDMELQDVHFEHEKLKKDSSLYYVKRKEWVKENLEGAKYTRDLPYEVVNNPKNNIDGYRIGFEFDQNGIKQTQYSYYLMCNKRMFHLKSHYLSSKASSDGVALQKIASNFRCEADGNKVGRFSRAEIRDNWKKANQTEEGQEATIEALREFFIDYELSHDKNVNDEKDDLEAKLEKAKTLLEALLGHQKAYASDSANNCFYAGWVSEWARSGNNMYCATPPGAKGCGEGQIKCNPAVFGNVCISTDYQQQATQKCNSEYGREKQKHFAEIKQHLKANPSSLGEVQKAADDLCDSKPYSDSNYSLCTSLYDRVAKIDPQGSPKRDEVDAPQGVDPDNYREAYDSTQGLLQLIENHCMTPEGDMYASVTVQGKHIDCIKAKETAMKNLKALDQVGVDTNFSNLKGEACEYVDPTTPLKKVKEEFEKKDGPVCSKEELAKKKNCTNDFLCAAAASATFGIPIKVGKCDLHRDSCLINAMGAILKSLWETVKGLASLAGKVIAGVASDAWKATKNATKSVLNWFGASYKIDNASSYKCVQLAKSGGGMIANFMKDPPGSMKKFFNGIWNGINQWMMQDAFCQEWYGGAHISKCLKPSSGWECLSCKEKINGTCTIAGYLATELAAAFFTGGTATAVKMTGVGAKIVSMLSKGAKLGKLSRAKLVTKFLKLSKAGSVLGKGAKVSAKVGAKVLKATGKGTLWTLKKLSGPVKSVYSRLANMKVVKVAAKPVNFAGAKGKKFLNWYSDLNKKVYHAGKDLVEGLFKKPSKTNRAHASTELALNAQRRADKVDDMADAGKNANQSEKTANANFGKKTDSSDGTTNAKSGATTSDQAENVLVRKLSDEEKDLFYRAHNEGRGAKGKDGVVGDDLDPINKNVSIQNLEKVDTGSVKWQQLSDDVDPTDYNSFRKAHDTNDFSGDAKYISYWDDVRKERLGGKVIRKDADGLIIKRVDGNDIRLNDKQIQSARNSTTSKDLLGFYDGILPKQEKFFEKLNLKPVYNYTDGSGVKMTFTEPFESNGYIHSYVIVEKEGQKHLRLAYKSNSSGVFRIADGVVLDDRKIEFKENQTKGWYSKGIGEQLMTLPSEVQEQLQKGALEISNLKKIDFDDEIANIERNAGDDRWGLLFEKYKLNSKPGLADKTHEEVWHQKGEIRHPSDVKIISEKLRPDYSKPKSTYKSKTGAAGEVEVMVYSSKDGTVEYTMFKDKEGKVWFGDVYTKTGSTNRYAVKDGSYDFDAVLAPRWEYEKQIPIIYESKNRVKSPVNSRYHSNWNYVREMPEVKRWYESQGLKVPEGD